MKSLSLRRMSCQPRFHLGIVLDEKQSDVANFDFTKMKKKLNNYFIGEKLLTRRNYV